MYVYMSVFHVVVGMLWHCEGAPPHLNAIWKQGKTCNYYHEIR